MREVIKNIKFFYKQEKRAFFDQFYVGKEKYRRTIEQDPER